MHLKHFPLNNLLKTRNSMPSKKEFANGNASLDELAIVEIKPTKSGKGKNQKSIIKIKLAKKS